MDILKNYLFLTVQVLSVITVQSFNTTTISNIHTAILTDYDIGVRPASLTDVHVQFNLLHINELNIRTQTLTTSGWFSVEWVDTRLTWLPSNYENVDFIYLKESKIWKPELIVGNVVSAISSVAGNDLLIQVKHDGSLHWDPPGLYKTHCNIDVRYFPYDKQTCTIELTSWSYTTAYVTLSPEMTQINTAGFYGNGEWDVTQTFVNSKELVENGDIFDQLVFGITMERKPHYYLQSVIFPVILISVLTIVVFLLPVESGEKISFGLTVLLSLAVLLTVISDKLPTTAVHTSILGVYLTATLALSTLSIIISVFIVRLYHRCPQDNVPVWLQKITNVILVPCFNKRNSSVESIKEKKTSQEIEEKTDNITDAWSDSRGLNKEEKFQLKCCDIAYMIDKFFLIIFLVITVIATVIFLFVMAYGSG